MSPEEKALRELFRKIELQQILFEWIRDRQLYRGVFQEIAWNPDKASELQRHVRETILGPSPQDD